MKNIAIIPARSGSKGLKNKNIKLLLGRPLIAYSIDAAIDSGVFDTVMVSTDSEEYAKIAREYGADVPFLRSPELAGDKSDSWDVVREVLRRYSEKGNIYDYAVLLQPTSPLRKPEDIQNAFSMIQDGTANSVVSVTELDHPMQWCFRLGDSGYINDLAKSPYIHCRRQDLEPYYRLNGAIYIVNATKIEDENYSFYADLCRSYVMPRERSVDIDTEFDFKYASLLLDDLIPD